MNSTQNILSNFELISFGEAKETSKFFISLSTYHFNNSNGEKKSIDSPKWAKQF